MPVFRIEFQTPGRGFHELTDEVTGHVRSAGIGTGLCHLFIRHTSASLLITENADPAVRADLERFMSRIAPDGDPDWTHGSEGPDDMPAHIRSVLTASELTLPIREGRLSLGTWQGIYLWEHRTRPRHRVIDLTLLRA
ncbi:secondary thiamine-phosphate synthase enzyme YjbQ [Elongatibacter sediminis]|uniref:Secondary thiamine-phosphate synthase enzyme YjbQ n=1 Tax=Elongatibacter sediminis TaxID=3119006 RepID=A0AAW9RKK3_9GAMM